MNLLLWLAAITTPGLQECPATRPLTAAEVTFQSHTISQLQAIFENQRFMGYVLDLSSETDSPRVWTEVCVDRKPSETFNLLGYYTYVLDPGSEESRNTIERINSLRATVGNGAVDEIRNLENASSIGCEWGINTIPFTLRNLGSEIEIRRFGDATVFRLNNAYKNDSKAGDVRHRTVIVKGEIEVVDEVEQTVQGKLYKKSIRVPVVKTHFTSRLNAFLVITGGKEEIHRQLNLPELIVQLNQLVTR